MKDSPVIVTTVVLRVIAWCKNNLMMLPAINHLDFQPVSAKMYYKPAYADSLPNNYVSPTPGKIECVGEGVAVAHIIIEEPADFLIYLLWRVSFGPHMEELFIHSERTTLTYFAQATK